MIKILFVCHGNICRSPMAEFAMKDLVNKHGLDRSFLIESAATSSEELGNHIYPPALRKLRSEGIGTPGNELGVSKKRARRINSRDYDQYDLLIGMDSANLRSMMHLYHNDPQGKIHSLMEFTDRPGSVADPWYTGDFNSAWLDVSEGCRGLLDYLKKTYRLS